MRSATGCCAGRGDRRRWSALGEGNPVGHHITNVVVLPGDDDTARVLSKGLGVTTDGRVGSVAYEDDVVRTTAGWRVARRTVTPRRRPLHP